MYRHAAVCLHDNVPQFIDTFLNCANYLLTIFNCFPLLILYITPAFIRFEMSYLIEFLVFYRPGEQSELVKSANELSATAEGTDLQHTEVGESFYYCL